MGISLLRPTRAGGSCCGAGGGLTPNTSEPCTALGAAQDPPPGSHRGLEAPAARGTAPNTGRTLRPLPGLRHQGTVQRGPAPPPAAPCSPRSPSPPPHCTPSCSPSPVPLALSCLLLGSALCWHQDPLPTWGPPRSGPASVMPQEPLVPQDAVAALYWQCCLWLPSSSSHTHSLVVILFS